MPWPPFITPADARTRAVLPGQAPVEALLFHAWLERHYAEYELLATNVRLGQGEDPGASYPDFARRYVTLTTQKRADLVLLKDQAVTIAEIKIQAGLPSIGQLLGYRILWQREFPQFHVDHMLVIAHHLSVDTATALLHVGIGYELFPDVAMPDLTLLPSQG